MEAFNRYLQQFPQYHPTLFDTALPYLSVRTLDAGEHLLRAGNVCKQLALVEKGLLRLFYPIDGKEITHCFCKEHTISSSFRSFLAQQASDISIQAVEPSQLITLSYESLQILYQQDPFWQQVGRLATENELITAECHHRFLRDLSATERYTHILEHEQELLQRVPLHYLASYLQITPETLSRIRHKLART